jgi:hypothetical protein
MNKQTLDYLGFLVFGIITLVYHEQINNDVIRLYPSLITPTCDGGVPITGFTFLLFWLGALLGVLPDQTRGK